jgi:hypothetical protein
MSVARRSNIDASRFAKGELKGTERSNSKQDDQIGKILAQWAWACFTTKCLDKRENKPLHFDEKMMPNFSYRKAFS